MIKVEGSLALFEGTSKELSLEFIHTILGFKQCLIKEYSLDEDSATEVVNKCIEIAIINNEQRTEFINGLLKDINEGE